MRRTASALLAAFALAGCAQQRTSALAPAPEQVPPRPVAQMAELGPPPVAVPDSAAAADSAAIADSVVVSDSDLTAGATEVFGDSAAVLEPSWDIDVLSYETRDRVQHYVSLFSGDAKARITRWLERGTRYEPMIRRTFKEEGLPEDMYYLGLIESGYNPDAYSSAAAVGMWQFMARTARGMGLRVDWWVDDRRDPVKSTQAAGRFLRSLSDRFGSMYLAAAAYDGGPGRVSRGLKRYADDLQDSVGDDLFFQLVDKDFFHAETREYVPQLIAAALVAKDPARYGMEIQPESAFVYDSVRVAPRTPLAAIARATGATVDEIQALNPQILRGMAPPDDSINVRIPLGSAVSFDSALAALPASVRVGTRYVTSRTGEYASTIARKYGITTRQLEEFNPTLHKYQSGHLKPGQRVLVPSAEVVKAARSVPNPSIELYGLVNGRYTVRSGDTLSGLAVKYHSTVKRLMELNHLKSDRIYIGQRLIITHR
ncbi:MAG TPA: LysM peptidoglycan-binding domain-containing protein [Gemmatimonadaceae bacterium]|nr:LysM peptidoglycan-binding domain-containing protein [Gemmatimonadaceae bacterium]